MFRIIKLHRNLYQAVPAINFQWFRIQAFSPHRLFSDLDGQRRYHPNTCSFIREDTDYTSPPPELLIETFNPFGRSHPFPVVLGRGVNREQLFIVLIEQVGNLLLDVHQGIHYLVESFYSYSTNPLVSAR